MVTQVATCSRMFTTWNVGLWRPTSKTFSAYDAIVSGRYRSRAEPTYLYQ